MVVDGVMAGLAFAVAGMYVVIALGVVPRLGRAGVEDRALRAGRWGASAFFLGCAVTHLGIGLQALAALRSPTMTTGSGMGGAGSTSMEVLRDLLPHCAQIVGGGLFIGIARSRLEWTVTGKEVAERLRVRERHFRYAFERSPVGIALVDLSPAGHGRLLEVNRSLCELVGLEPAAARGATLTECFATTEPGLLTAGLQQLVLAGSTLEQETEILLPDGRRSWLGVGASLVADDDRAESFAVLLVRDLGGQRRAERLRSMQHAVAQVVAAEVSVPSGLAGVVQQVCEHLGWAGGEYWHVDGQRDVIARLTSWWDPQYAGSPLDRSGDVPFDRVSTLAAALLSGRSMSWVADLRDHLDSYSRAGPAAATGLNSVVALPIRSGEQGGILTFFAAGIAQPDEELTSALAAVAAYAARFVERRRVEELRRFVESSPDGVVIVDAHGRITQTNLQVERMFGYAAEDLAGQQLELLAAPGCAPDWLAGPGAGGIATVTESTGLRRDGARISVEITRNPVAADGGLLVSHSIRDVTERRQAERALARARDEAVSSSQAFEAFSYSVAHDLRAPLRAIDGFSQSLAEEYSSVLDEPGLRHLQRVQSAARTMAQLIDGLLELARVTHRGLARDRVDLSAVVAATHARLAAESPGRAVEVVVEPGLTVDGDETLLTAAVENLVANAWKFTRDRPQARIEFGRDGGGYFLRDNGAGFDMTYSGKLFGVFQRLHNAREFEGTGIGLATVQRIVQRHGGRIWADGAVGQGATFHFTLDGSTG